MKLSNQWFPFQRQKSWLENWDNNIGLRKSLNKLNLDWIFLLFIQEHNSYAVEAFSPWKLFMKQFFICFSFHFMMCKYYEWEEQKQIRFGKWKLCRFIVYDWKKRNLIEKKVFLNFYRAFPPTEKILSRIFLSNLI